MTGLIVPSIAAAADSFPRPLSGYPPPAAGGLWLTLCARARAEPFDVVATLIFALAIAHTFLTPKIRSWARAAEGRHGIRGRKVRRETGEEVPEVSFQGQILHFLGEVEVVFGLWAIVLVVAITSYKSWRTATDYVGSRVDYTEPLFVMVIMALASTRPIMRLAELLVQALSELGGRTIGATWLAILIFGPLLGSFVTEPGAMTICAILLARQFYHYDISLRLKYATIGLLFVNVSVGGTLTQFAAPPMIMVAGPWHWDLPFMFLHFGWRAAVGIVASTLLYYLAFRGEFRRLERQWLARDLIVTPNAETPIPAWILGAHIVIIAAAVAVSDRAPLFLGVFLLYLAFSQATAHHQNKPDLRPPLMVGFFLAGLVIHGGLQSWWLQPVLNSLGRMSLFWGATFLTSFNDNAAITYLATLVPHLSDAFKHAVVAGAVTGGGLTVIANAPNPAGQSILQSFFPGGVSPIKLASAALLPTLIMAAAFMLWTG